MPWRCSCIINGVVQRANDVGCCLLCGRTVAGDGAASGRASGWTASALLTYLAPPRRHAYAPFAWWQQACMLFGQRKRRCWRATFFSFRAMQRRAHSHCRHYPRLYFHAGRLSWAGQTLARRADACSWVAAAPLVLCSSGAARLRVGCWHALQRHFVCISHRLHQRLRALGDAFSRIFSSPPKLSMNIAMGVPPVLRQFQRRRLRNAAYVFPYGTPRSRGRVVRRRAAACVQRRRAGESDSASAARLLSGASLSCGTVERTTAFWARTAQRLSLPL